MEKNGKTGRTNSGKTMVSLYVFFFTLFFSRVNALKRILLTKAIRGKMIKYEKRAVVMWRAMSSDREKNSFRALGAKIRRLITNKIDVEAKWFLVSEI